MKTSTVTLALAAAAVASVSAQDLCSTTAVRGFLIDTNAKACATATGVAWKPFRPYNPTEIAAFCATPSCLTFLATLPPLNPVECKIPGGENPLLYADLLNKVKMCSGSPSPTPTTAAPVPTTAAPVPTTAAPVPTTAAPVPTTVAPVPTTAAPVPTTAAPVPTTAAPVPTTAAPVPTTVAPAPTTVTPTVAPTPEPTTPVKPSC